MVRHELNKEYGAKFVPSEMTIKQQLSEMKMTLYFVDINMQVLLYVFSFFFRLMK